MKILLVGTRCFWPLGNLSAKLSEESYTYDGSGAGPLNQVKAVMVGSDSQH